MRLLTYARHLLWWLDDVLGTEWPLSRAAGVD